MRRFLRLLAAVEVAALGLWMPGLVFTCLARVRREILLELEDERLLLRDFVDEDVEEDLVLEDLSEGFWPLTDDLTAISEDAGSSHGCRRKRGCDVVLITAYRSNLDKCRVPT
jgi:hypothetical protein